MAPLPPELAPPIIFLAKPVLPVEPPEEEPESEPMSGPPASPEPPASAAAAVPARAAFSASFAAFSATTDRGWAIYTRILWIVGVWLLHSILVVPGLLISYRLLEGLPHLQHLAERGGIFFAAIPLAIWCMWRSRFFVESIAGKNSKPVSPFQN